MTTKKMATRDKSVDFGISLLKCAESDIKLASEYVPLQMIADMIQCIAEDLMGEENPYENQDDVSGD
jgi:hypothetical protein